MQQLTKMNLVNNVWKIKKNSLFSTISKFEDFFKPVSVQKLKATDFIKNLKSAYQTMKFYLHLSHTKCCHIDIKLPRYIAIEICKYRLKFKLNFKGGC